MVQHQDVTDEDRSRDDWDYFLYRIEDLEEIIRDLKERVTDRRHEDRVSVTGHPGWSE